MLKLAIIIVASFLFKFILIHHVIHQHPCEGEEFKMNTKVGENL